MKTTRNDQAQTTEPRSGTPISAMLLEKIHNRTASIAVIGAGYVGLPFSVESATAGFTTVAYDLSSDKVDAINAGRSYIDDISDDQLAPLVATSRLAATTDSSVLRSADAIIICVPTPLNKTKDPDISAIMSAADAIIPHLHAGQLIVLESTTYPGFTREILKDHLEKTDLIVGKDLALAFSPERVDPGNQHFGTHNTPKVIGGYTDACTRIACSLYETFIKSIVPVSSCDAAEMVKLLENTFRAVNIGLVNEVALMCHKLGLDTWEVIDAAATKPFGFMPFYPGPGLGGHCIPVDPHYLSWKLKTLNYNARFIELAGVINSNMPNVTVEMIANALNDQVQPVKNSKILVVGVAYKADVSDVRESPALDVMKLLISRQADLSYHDPFVPEISLDGITFRSNSLDDLETFDCVVIITEHSRIDYHSLCARSRLIVDTRNATRAFHREFGEKIVTL